MAYRDTPENRIRRLAMRKRNREARTPEQKAAEKLRNDLYRQRKREDPVRIAAREAREAAARAAREAREAEREAKRAQRRTPEQVRADKLARRRGKRGIATLSPEQQAKRREQNRAACQRWRAAKTVKAEAEGITFEALRMRQRRAAWTEAQWEEHRRKHREYQARRRDAGLGPCPRRRRELQVRKYRLEAARNPAQVRDGTRVAFPACAAPTQERELLVRLLAAVKPCDDRDDIVGQAAILILEGRPFAEAVREARRTVMREVGFLRHSTRPIDECHFL